MDVSTALLLVAGIIWLGLIGEYIFHRTDIPNTLWLLLLGLLLGPVFNLLPVGPLSSISGFVSAIAIITILFEGGLSLDIYRIVRQMSGGFVLMIVGVIFSIAAVTGVMVAFGFSVFHGLLMGSILAGTSSSIVIPIVTKTKSIGDEAKMVLSLESITDTFSIVIAFALMDAILLGAGTNIKFALTQIISDFSIGAVIGIVSGVVWMHFISKIKKYTSTQLETLGFVFLLYAGTEFIQGNGAIACFVFGIMLGNGKNIYEMFKIKRAPFELGKIATEFYGALTFLVRSFFFVYIGLLVTLTNFFGIVVGAIVTLALLIVRPLGIWLTTARSNAFSSRDKRIMTIMLPRGLSSAALAQIVVSNGVPGTSMFVDIVFIVILGTVLVYTIGIILIKRMKYDGDEGTEKEHRKIIRPAKKLTEPEEKEEHEAREHEEDKEIQGEEKKEEFIEEQVTEVVEEPIEAK